MTLVDLFRLLRKYWVVVLAATLACGGAAGAYTLMSKSTSHSATAAIVGNSQAGGVMGFANAEGRVLLDPESDYGLEAKVESGTTTVTVTVSGAEEDECIRLANAIAEKAFARAEMAYEAFENPYVGTVEAAEMTEEVKSGGGMKYLLVGVLAGLFLGVCIVVIIDMVRRPVKSIEGMQDLVELPVLEKLPAESGERLLANIRFAGKKDDLSRVCVVPLGVGAAAADVCALLDGAMRAEEAGGKSVGRDAFRAVACEPLSSGMGGAYEAREADAAVVVARQWADSLAALEGTVAELRLAGANVVGLVFAG